RIFHHNFPFLRLRIALSATNRHDLMERISTEFPADHTQRFVRSSVLLRPDGRCQKQKPYPQSPHPVKLNSALTDCPSPFCVVETSPPAFSTRSPLNQRPKSAHVFTTRDEKKQSRI